MNKELGSYYRLLEKEFEIIGEFSCLGFDTSGPLRFVGGKNKEHPNGEDLDKARKFAVGLRNGFKFTEIKGKWVVDKVWSD